MKSPSPLPPTLSPEILRVTPTAYKRLFETARDGILILNSDNLKIIDANPFMLELLEYTHAEFVGKELWEIGLFRDKGASQAAFKELQANGFIRYEDLPLETRSGKRREVEFVSNAYEADGIELIQCNIRDITERRQAEVLRERLAAIVKSSEDAIMSTDLDGIVTTWNTAAEKMFGYSETQILGEPLSLIIPPDREDEIPRILKLIMRGETLDHFETMRIASDGRAIDVSVTISPIKDDDGNIVGASKIARNISELKRAIARITQLNADMEQRVIDRTTQLEAVNKELEAFSYSVSHDLRAPLRHIDGFVQLLVGREAEKLDPTSGHYLTVISNAVGKMGLLIDELLAFSRTGRQEVLTIRIDLNDLVQETLRILKPSTTDRAIDWKIGHLPAVEGDVTLLGLVMTNLISNAVKFTSGREKALIEIGVLDDADDRATIFVRDNGAGFDMRYADKLFGVFKRLHREDEFEGIGIGLATAQRIVNRHGGRIWAEGEIDRGATFNFTLMKAQGGANGQ